MINTIRNFFVSLLAPKYRAQGIDGSHWWGVFNPKLATKPVDFIIIKATEGTTMVDSSLAGNMAGASAVPVRGLYHYQRSHLSWLAQADHFLRTAAPYAIQVLALDVENAGNEDVFTSVPAANTFFSDMRRIIDYWKFKESGKRILLYTNINIYQNYMFPTIKKLYGIEGVQWLESLDLWLANVNGQGVDGNPNMPTNRATPWKVWQFSSNGRKEDYGTQGDVDLNVFNGTVEQLHVWAGLTETQPPPPPIEPPTEPEEPEPEPEPIRWTGRVVAFERLIVRHRPRKAPETDAGLRLMPNEKVSGQLWAGNDYVWMKLDDTNPETVKGKWVAVRKPGGDTFIKIDPQPTSPGPGLPLPQLWRVKHDVEMGELWRTNLPEVFRLEPLHSIPLNREWQLFTKALNPTMEPKKWRALFAYSRAFTNNGAGYDRPGDSPKADFVNGRDIKSIRMPAFDQPRICGGALVTGRVEGNRLWLSYIDASKSPPDIADVRLWQKFCALNVTANGISKFPQGGGADVWIPLIARIPVSISLSKLEKLDMSKPLPDPYKIYVIR
jgi:lysozyme